jgi:hypothetical protein
VISTFARYYAPYRSLPGCTSYPPVPTQLPTWRNCVYVLEYERRSCGSEGHEERLRGPNKHAAMEGRRY